MSTATDEPDWRRIATFTIAVLAAISGMRTAGAFLLPPQDVRTFWASVIVTAALCLAGALNHVELPGATALMYLCISAVFFSRFCGQDWRVEGTGSFIVCGICFVMYCTGKTQGVKA